MKNLANKAKNNLGERLANYNLNLVEFVSSLPKHDEDTTIAYELLSKGTNMLVSFNEMNRSKDKKHYEKYLRYIQVICAESQFLFLKLLHQGANKKDIVYFTDELSNYSNLFHRKLAA